MNPLVVLTAVLATARAGLIAPYAGLPLAGALPYNYPLAGVYAGAYAPTVLPAPVAPVKVEAAKPAEPVQIQYAAAPVIAAPIAAPIVPAAAPSSQFRAQDEFGNHDFGYTNINSARRESGNALVGVTGSYQYVDANGVLQTTNYIADGLGFRVQATNLPVAPTFEGKAPVFDLEAPVDTGVAPLPVKDTPEVEQAKAEFLAKFEEEKNRAKRSTPAATAPLVPAAPIATYAPYALPSPALYNGLGLLGYNGYYGYPGAYAAPALAAPALAAPALAAPALAAPAAAVSYSAAAPAAPIASTLTQIKLNPGHAVFYKVDQN